jgi:hypothetical protein
VGDLLHLHDGHGRVQRLIPWFVNGSLDERDQELVRAHCKECGECRADIAREQELREAIASLPSGADRGWAGLRDKVLKRPPPAERGIGWSLRRPVALGWALAGQLAVAASLTLAFLTLAPAEPEPGYRLLASPDQAGGGNVIVLFAPDMTEETLRVTLKAVDARIVDGPTASGAYVLRVAGPDQAKAISRLRAVGAVLLAEPLSPGSTP